MWLSNGTGEIMKEVLERVHAIKAQALARGSRFVPLSIRDCSALIEAAKASIKEPVVKKIAKLTKKVTVSKKE